MEDKNNKILMQRLLKGCMIFLAGGLIIGFENVLGEIFNIDKTVLKIIQLPCVIAIIYALYKIIKVLLDSRNYMYSDRNDYKMELENLIKEKFNLDVYTTQSKINKENIIERQGNQIYNNFTLKNENFLYRKIHITYAHGSGENKQLRNVFNGTHIAFATSLPNNIILKNRFEAFCLPDIDIRKLKKEGDFKSLNNLSHEEINLLENIKEYISFIDAYSFMLLIEDNILNIYIIEKDDFNPKIIDRLEYLENIFNLNLR